MFGQNTTVRFDRPGIYDAQLTVVFNDFDSGFSRLKIIVNDPSPTTYSLIENNYEVTRDITDNKKLIWIVEKDGGIIMRRNAQGESSYTYHDNTTGTYRIWLARFYNGSWSKVSNIVSYSR